MHRTPQTILCWICFRNNLHFQLISDSKKEIKYTLDIFWRPLYPFLNGYKGLQKLSRIFNPFVKLSLFPLILILLLHCVNFLFYTIIHKLCLKLQFSNLTNCMLYLHLISCPLLSRVNPSGPVVIIHATVSEVCRFKPGQGRWIFSECRNPEYDFLRKGSKAMGSVVDYLKLKLELLSKIFGTFHAHCRKRR